MEEFIQCEICKASMKRVTTTHLKNKHNLTAEQYKEKFPNAKLISEATAAKVGATHKGKIVSAETRLKQAEAKTGEKNHYYGVARPEHSALMKKDNPMMDPEKRANHLAWANSDSNKKRVAEQIDEKTGLSIGQVGGINSALSGKAGPKSILKGSYSSSKTGNSEWFASSYELQRFIQLDADPMVKSWTKKHEFRVRFLDTVTEKVRYHLPDLEVILIDGSKRVEEIKGWFKDEDRIKVFLAEEKCKQLGLVYLFLGQENFKMVPTQLRDLLISLTKEGRVKLLERAEAADPDE